MSMVARSLLGSLPAEIDDTIITDALTELRTAFPPGPCPMCGAPPMDPKWLDDPGVAA